MMGTCMHIWLESYLFVYRVPLPKKTYGCLYWSHGVEKVRPPVCLRTEQETVCHSESCVMLPQSHLLLRLLIKDSQVCQHLFNWGVHGYNYHVGETNLVSCIKAKGIYALALSNTMLFATIYVAYTCTRLAPRHTSPP